MPFLFVIVAFILDLLYNATPSSGSPEASSTIKISCPEAQIDRDNNKKRAKVS